MMKNNHLSDPSVSVAFKLNPHRLAMRVFIFG